MNTHTKLQLPTICQSCDTRLDSLYCGKWGTILKSFHDLDLDRTMPNVNSSEIFSFATILSNLKFLD